MTPLIEFRSVGKTFDTSGRMVEAVRDVSFSIATSEFITVVGPSGCGKSTLLNMIAGLFQPSTGEVRYAGKQVTALNQRTGYMTQNDHLLPWRDIAGNIRVPLEIAGMSKSEMADRVMRLMARMGLSGFERAYPSQLSGGMRKRAALARLLAYDPETLLMDEPFAALDAQLRLKMQTELRLLCRQLHKTVLFVTHDLDEAVALGDRILLFSGRPGTICRVITSTLELDRDVRQMRRDPEFARVTSDLWDALAAAGEVEA